MDASSPREPLGLFITRVFLSFVKRLWLLDHEPFRAHCSSDLNISNVHPKDLSFVIAESFPTFIHCIMPNPEDPDRFQQNWHQQIQHWCIQMNWSPDQVKDLPYKTNELIPTRLPTPTRTSSPMTWFQVSQFPNQVNKFILQNKWANSN